MHTYIPRLSARDISDTITMDGEGGLRVNDLKYESLIRFIHYAEKDLGVKICVKDHIGFVSLDRELDMSLMENLIHGNPFCMYMKSDERVYIKCMHMQQGVIRRLERDDRPFCGVCHAGVKEYVCPIAYRGRMIGSVNAGVFACDEKYAYKYIERACRGMNLDADRAYSLYKTHICGRSVDEERLYVNLEMIAFSFSMVFARMSVHNEFDDIRPATVMSHSVIISDALEFLKQNYLEDISAPDVAANCHCSVSCLSHLFKSRVGMSLPLYLAKLRVDHARKQLISDRAPISVIADRSGFSDPNYFSRIFTQYVGLTPSLYRKRYMADD